MTIPSRKHQGFNPAISDHAPRGTVLLAEPQKAHTEFLDEIPLETRVLIRVHHAERLVRKGETAETYYGENTTVITTTTVHDRILSDLSWQRELDVIREFEPDYHIPCDYPVYKHDQESQRREHVLSCLEGTLWIGQRLRDVKTEIIPLVKGETPGERSLCYRVYRDIGAEYVAVYGAQYFLSGKGFKPLQRLLQNIASEAPNLKLMIIGLQSPRLLEKAPPQVVAAAGQRWIKETRLRKVPTPASAYLYDKMNERIHNAVSSGQAPLSMFTEPTEVTA
ncbi:hypothetical protein [Haloferax volcanii]|uniref:Uncharacterized protein n=1 Tax=Haloferax volcanii TaxID=2246 RepID=A0A558G4Z1_HALVO|nr:hypothetical protein [Haloferax volcanii]TVT92818.1 hypothetical protein FQA18_16835 [Haloferax volcanii]